MCGFVAIINTPEKNSKYKKKIEELSKINNHRGPDETKILENKNYLLLFKRLKIIDLSSGGSQPFIDKEKKITLVFNGEIYNYIELKNELENSGINFRSSSDTEVLLKSFIHWGLKFIEKIRGMFSIVIFDNNLNKIYCFRDQLGQKPLFYSNFDGGLIISSEIKDILEIKRKPIENNKTILKYLVRGWCDDNENTYFKEIYSLPAASYMTYQNKSLRIIKYWKLNIIKNYDYNREEFCEIFKSNLKLHLRSDVPIAFTLSGGLDSSSLIKTALDLKFDNYKAYSIKSKFVKENDESSYIDDFVKVNNINHTYLNINKFNKTNLLENFINFQDEPVNDASFIYQYLLRKKIKKDGFKVLIVGEGGDEVLGGYNRMFIPYIINNYLKNKKKIPSWVKKNIENNLGYNFKFFQKKLLHYFENFNTLNNDIEDKSVFDVLYIKESKIPDELKFYNNSNPRNNNYFKNFLSSHLFNRDLPHILRQEDRVSMSQSIENRSPFVDYKFIEYVFGLSENNFMKNGCSKFMLRDIMRSKLPKKHLNKKKIGRPGNSKFLIFNFYFEKICDLLNSKTYENEFFDNNFILENITKEKKVKKIKNYNIYFRILNFLLWKENIGKYTQR